jgi:CspA family cold shock protein
MAVAFVCLGARPCEGVEPDEGGKDVFVHASALERGGIHALNGGDRVSFVLEDDRRGRGKQAGQLKRI